MIGEWASGDTYNEHWYAETLFRKTNGEFFVVLQGGALSPHGERLMAGSRIFAKTIRPLSDDDALEWVAYRMDGDAVEALFAGVITE